MPLGTLGGYEDLGTSDQASISIVEAARREDQVVWPWEAECRRGAAGGHPRGCCRHKGTPSAHTLY